MFNQRHKVKFKLNIRKSRYEVYLHNGGFLRDDFFSARADFFAMDKIVHGFLFFVEFMLPI